MNRARWVLPAIAILLTAATVVILTLSIGTIRSRSFFDRTIRRIETLDRRGEYTREFSDELREAARHARSRADWRRILQLAWQQPEPMRWDTVRELAFLASGALPDDARWKSIGAFAALRSGAGDSALEMLQGVRPAGDTIQYLRVLASITRDDPAATRDRMRNLIETDPGETAEVLARAFVEPRSETLLRAWEISQIESFALNSALHAAAEGKREEARSLAAILQDRAIAGRASLYLAAWLQDTDWLFRQLRRLPPRDGVAPDVLLLQADGHIGHEQWDQARRIYRELQSLEPGLSPVIFLNDAVLAALLEGESALPILERGEEHHREDIRMQFVLAGALLRAGREQEAKIRLEELVTYRPRNHAAWLLLRLIHARADAARGAPPERLESDLWVYLNDHPEAHEIAAFLARLLLLRGDSAGTAELRRRYAPEEAPWAATVHAANAIQRGMPERADQLLADNLLQESPHWTMYYNHALTALQFNSLPEGARRIEAFRTWWNRTFFFSDERRRRSGTYLYLLEAELARLQGNEVEALAIVDRAIALSPDQESLYSFRARIAPRD